MSLFEQLRSNPTPSKPLATGAMQPSGSGSLLDQLRTKKTAAPSVSTFATKKAKPIEEYFASMRADTATYGKTDDATLLSYAKKKKAEDDAKNKYGVYDLIGDTQQLPNTSGDFMDTVGKLFSGVKDVVAKPLSTVIDVINRPQNALYGAISGLASGKNPLEEAWKGLTKQEDYFNLLERLGWNSEAPILAFKDWNVPLLKDLLGNVSDRDIAQFALDVVSDPLNALTLGGAKAGKYTLSIADDLAEGGVKQVVKGFTKEATEKVGQMTAKAMAETSEKIGREGIEKLAMKEGIDAVQYTVKAQKELSNKFANELFQKYGDAVIDKGGIGLKLPGMAKKTLVSGEALGKGYGLAKRVPIVGDVLNAGEDLIDASKGLFASNPFYKTKGMSDEVAEFAEKANPLARKASDVKSYLKTKDPLIAETISRITREWDIDDQYKLLDYVQDPTNKIATSSVWEISDELARRGIPLSDEAGIRALRESRIADKSNLALQKKYGKLINTAETPSHVTVMPTQEVLDGMKKPAFGSAREAAYKQLRQVDPITGEFIDGTEDLIGQFEKTGKKLFTQEAGENIEVPLEQAMKSSDEVLSAATEVGQSMASKEQRRIATAIAEMEGRSVVNAVDYRKAEDYMDTMFNRSSKVSSMSDLQRKDFYKLNKLVGDVAKEGDEVLQEAAGKVGKSFDDVVKQGDEIMPGVYKTKEGTYYKEVDRKIRTFDEQYKKGVSKLSVEKDLGKVYLADAKKVQVARANAELFDLAQNSQLLKKVTEELPEGWRGIKTSYLAGFAAPDEIAKMFENFNKSLFFADESTNWLVKFLDRATNVFKKTALMTMPGAIPYNARNWLNNNWAMYIGDVDIAGTQLAAKGFMHKDENFKWMGKNRETILGEVNALGVLDIDAIRDYEFILDGGKKSFLDKIPVVGKPIKGLAYEYGENIAKYVESTARIQTYLDGLKKGLDPEQAALRVKKLLFDYSELSAFEKNVMKRVFPFYTFTRKNVPLQLEMLFNNPAKLNKIGSGMRFIQSTSANKPMTQEEIDSVPDYIWNYNPFFLGTPGNRYFISMDGFISAADYAKPLNPFQTALEMFHPYPKVALENATNYDFYLKKPVRDIEGARDEFLGQSVDPMVRKVLSIFRPISDINRINPNDVFGKREGDPEQAIRYLGLTGTKPKAIDLAKSKDSKLANAKRTLSLLASKYNEAKTESDRQHWVYEIKKIIKENGGDVLAIMNSSLQDENQMTQKELDAKIRKSQLKRGTQ